MKILVLGATGLVGKNVLAQALAHSAATCVVAPTRRRLIPHPKLINPVSDRLESLLGATQGVDAVVCALGTTIGKAGSKEAFREVDYVLPLAFARSAHEYGVGDFCPRLGERCLCQLCDVLSTNQGRDRARHRASGLRITHHRSTKPHRRRAGRTAVQGRRRIAIDEHLCADSPKEVSHQSCARNRVGDPECCHDGQAGPPFSLCRKLSLTRRR